MRWADARGSQGARGVVRSVRSAPYTHAMPLSSAKRLAVALFWPVLAVALAAQSPRDRHIVGPESFTMRVLAAGLDNPWDLTWGPDSQLWVTERTGFRVARLNPADGSKQVALTVTDGYQAVVQDGLLGIAFHRDAGRDIAFLAYTYDRDPGPEVVRRIRVRRYAYDAATHTLGSPVDVLDDMPAHDDHGAGRLAVGPDGKLYFSRGDQGSNFLANYCNPNRAQDVPTADEVKRRDWSTYQGKILRMNLDGSIPADNPQFAGVRSHIYAIGLRNTQGLVFGPGGLLYGSDHGPSSDDELNVIESGRNYGWPNVAGFKDDRAYVYGNWSASAPAPCRTLKFDTVAIPPSVPQTKESAWSAPNFAPPITTFFTVENDYDFRGNGTATIAPAGIDIYTSPAIPGWATSILITGMRAGSLYRVKLGADRRTVTGSPLEYFRTANRYRDVVVSQDGRRIYLSTDSFGTTAGVDGARTNQLGHPGSVLEFTYSQGVK
jgi:PQQ-dependent dehydrogenase (s-GDH family)